jgi:hypothetical protein
MTPTNVTISSRGFQIQTPGDLEHVASLFYKSGMFQDVTDVSKASVKIMAGMELGIPPFAAMAQIRIIKGNIAIGATLLATLLRRHGYDYTVKEHDDDKCVLTFYRGRLGTSEILELGESQFTIGDAKQAQLMGSGMYNKFPRNMLFSRALSNGVKWYCPEISVGGAPIYTPDELDESLNEEGVAISGAETNGGGGTSSAEMAKAARQAKKETAKPKAEQAATAPAAQADASKSNVTEMPKPETKAETKQETAATQQQQQQQQGNPGDAEARDKVKALLAKLSAGVKCSPEVRRAALQRFWLTYFGINDMSEAAKIAPAEMVKALENLLVVLVTPEDFEAFISQTEQMTKIAKENNGKPVLKPEAAAAAETPAPTAGSAPAPAAEETPALFQEAAAPDEIDQIFPGIPAATKALVKQIPAVRSNVKIDAVKNAMVFLGARDTTDYLELHAILQVILGTTIWQKLLSYGKTNGVGPKMLVSFIEKKTGKQFAELPDEQIKAFVETVLPNVDPKTIATSAGF